MQRAGNSFIDALRWGTTLVAARLTVYVNGRPTQIVLPVSDATFTVDRNSEHRRTGQMTLEVLPTVPPQTVTVNGNLQTLLPIVPSALLAPFGNEVFVEMSIVQSVNGQNPAAGTNGWVPLGLFAIATSDVQDTGNNLTVTLELRDRSWAVAQRALLTAYTVPAAAGDLQSELIALLNTAWGSTPPWSYSITPNPGYTVPAGTYNQGQDPWQAALDMFFSAGYELYFDVNGNVVGAPVPTPLVNNSVVWNFVESGLSATGQSTHPVGGTPFTTPVDVALVMTRDGIPNSFFVSASGPNNASGTSTPVQANAADKNPASPTYINGPMGTVPSFIFDSLISTQAQALAEAQYNLSVALAKSWTVAVSTPPNPLFDIDDVCTITRSRLNLNLKPFVVDTITTSIKYDAVTIVKGRIVT